MHRSLRFIAALLLGAAVGCQNEGLSPAAVRPSFATGAASPTCAANPTVTVSDDTTLRAALKAARPGDVIAVSGTIEVTADDTIASDNQFQATDAFTGVHLQANGPDPNVVFPIRIDGARIERNTIVALTPSVGVRFGAIRSFDADNIVIADNVISGPWRNGISP